MSRVTERDSQMEKGKGDKEEMLAASYKKSTTHLGGLGGQPS
jgi:hypothetical protein